MQFPEFSKNIWEKIVLENDICVLDLCVKAHTPLFQMPEWEAVQNMLIEEITHEVMDQETGEMIFESDYQFLEYIDIAPKQSETGHWFFSYYDFLEEKRRENPEKSYVVQTITISPKEKTLTSLLDLTLEFDETKIQCAW